MSRRLFGQLFAICLLGVASALAAAACSNSPVEQAKCSSNSDCTSPQVCQDGYCVRPDDSDGPDVSWMAPNNDDYINGNVTLAVTASDEQTSVQQVRFVLDDESTTLGTDSDGSNGWSTKWDTTSVDDFQYTITAFATDAVGNEGSASITVTVDNSKPSIQFVQPEMDDIIQGNVDPDSQDGYAIQWCLSEAQPLLTDNPFTISYRGPGDTYMPATGMMGQEATSLAYATDTDDCDTSTDPTQPIQSFEWAVPDDSGPAFLRITASTLAGASTSAQQTFVVDSDFPVFDDEPLSRQSGNSLPLTGASVNGSLALAADVTDPTSSVSEVTFTIENSADEVIYMDSDDTPDNGFTTTWDTTSGDLPDGPYDIDLQATDVVGNTATTRADGQGDGKTTTVTVDNGGPSINISNPSDGDVVSDNVNISASATDDNTTVSEMAIFIDGDEKTSNNSNAVDYQWSTNNASNGSHDIRVTAVDTQGNQSSTTISVTVDNAAPSVSFTNPADGDIVSGDVSIEATASDQHGSLNGLTLDIDGTQVTSGNSSPLTFNWSTNSISDGNYPLTVTAEDGQGNQASTTINVTVDNSGPTITINNPTPASTVSGTVNISADASDSTTSITNMSVDVDGSNATSNSGNSSISYSWNTNNTADGSTPITITATDNNGNQSTESFTVTVDNTAPALTNLSPANNSVVSGAVSVSADANDTTSSVASMSITIDGTQQATSNSNSISTTWATDSGSFADGQYTVTFQAEDAVGNSASTSISVNVDNSAPSGLSIDSPSGGTTVNGSITFSASATDSNGVNYEFFAGNSSLGTASGSSGSISWNSNNTSDGSVTLEVVATDDLGNSTNTTISVTVDNTGPTLNFSNPSDGDVVSDTITIDGNASDANSSVSSMSIDIDGSTATSNSNNTISYSWNTNNNSDGAIPLTLSATDSVGNSSTTTITVTVDNSPPASLTIDSHSNNAVVGGTVTFTASATDPHGVSYDFKVDGSSVGSGSGASGSTSWDSTQTSDGAKTLQVTATDNQDNATSTSITIQVDNTDPNPSVDAPGSGSLLSGDVVIDGSATDGQTSIASISITAAGTTLKSDTSSPISATWSTDSAVSDGAYNISVTATDQAGNSATDTISVTIDNTDPTVSISNPSDGATLRDVVTIDGSSSDTNGIANMTLDIDSTQAQTSSNGNIGYSWDTATETDAPHTISISATDAAGNTNTSTISVTTDNTAPTSLSFDNLSSGDVLSGTVGVDVSATDGTSGISTLSLSGPNGSIGSVSGSTAGTIDWNTTNASDGTQQLTLTATDAAGNSSSINLSVEVDNTAPSNVQFNTPGDGDVVSGAATVQIDATDDETSIANIELQTPNTSRSSTNSTPVSFNWDTRMAADGNATLTAIATDQAGNTAQTQIQVSVDNDGPTITFNTLSDGLTVSGNNQSVDPSASDAGSSVASMTLSIDRAQVDSSSNASINYNWDTREEPDGKVRIDVEATDDTGNTSTKSIYVTVDNESVTVDVSTPSDGTCVSTGASVSITITPTGYTQPETDPSTANLDIDVIYNGNSTQFIQQNANWSNGSSFTVNWTAPASAVAASDLTINVEDEDYEGNNEDDESQDIVENFKVGSCP